MPNKITGAALLLAGLATAAWADGPSGRLAYLKGGAAWVVAPDKGESQKLPQSDKAAFVSLAPGTAAAYLFVPTKADVEDPNYRALVTLPPYKEAKPLAKPLNDLAAAGMIWSADGRSAFVNIGGLQGSVRLTAGEQRAVPYNVSSTTAKGDVVAYQTEKEIRLRWPATDEDKVIFSVGRPQPLFAALKKAFAPKNLKDLTSMIDKDLYTDQHNWQTSDPVLTPDGARLLFATNAGTGAGAAGNCTWCLISVDTKTGELAPLSKLGVLYGRVPHISQISPDGKKLLLVTSLHSSAVENPCQVYVIDLLTQAQREYLWADAKLKKNENLTSLVDGACWSPDGRYLAASVLYYDTSVALKSENWQPKDDDYSLDLFSVATGKIVKKIKGGHLPSWAMVE